MKKEDIFKNYGIYKSKNKIQEMLEHCYENSKYFMHTDLSSAKFNAFIMSQRLTDKINSKGKEGTCMSSNSGYAPAT
jgi:hypothetical protein